MIELPKDLATQAEWWCATNGHENPSGVSLTAEGRTMLFHELNRLPGVLQAGLALWSKRYEARLYPQSGKPMQESR